MAVYARIPALSLSTALVFSLHCHPWVFFSPSLFFQVHFLFPDHNGFPSNPQLPAMQHYHLCYFNRVQAVETLLPFQVLSLTLQLQPHSVVLHFKTSIFYLPRNPQSNLPLQSSCQLSLQMPLCPAALHVQIHVVCMSKTQSYIIFSLFWLH